MSLAPAIVTKLRERAARFHEITEQIALPEIATDGRKIRTLLQERGMLERSASLTYRLDEFLRRQGEDERVLAESTPDADLAELAREDLALVEEGLAEIESEVIAELIQDKDDERRKIIVEIRAGTGGDEATLFARDLFDIYKRYADDRHWRLETLDVSPSEIGGFKEIIFALEGDGAWKRLRFESGGHRVQRVPKTEAQGRIHTSAATVAVLPEAEDVDLNLRTEDLRIETMRAGGAGGQHVNKTESAVRITHIPTGIVAACQDDRSQLRNRASAMRMLTARLYDREQQRLHDERAKVRKEQVGSGDRSQRIRTYNWPQNRMTDHRANENFSLEAVLAGKIDPVLDALAALEREERIKNL